VRRCMVCPVAAAVGGSSIHAALHDATGRPWPAEPVQAPLSTEATTVVSTARIDAPTGEDVYPTDEGPPAGDAGRESRGAGLYAHTGPFRVPRSSECWHASSEEWPASALGSMIFAPDAILARDRFRGKVSHATARHPARSGSEWSTGMNAGQRTQGGPQRQPLQQLRHPW
jgi:hypothetical protein